MFVVRDDDGGSDLLFQTSDTTWQAYNQYGGNSLYTGQPAGPRVQGQLQPAVHDPRHRRRGLGLQRRVPDGPLARAQRLRRQLLIRASTADRRGRAARAQDVPVRRATTSTGPARSARTSRPRATPASTSPSSAATRCSGRPAGSQHRRLGTPTGRWSPTRRRTRTRRSTRSRPPGPGTWRDPRFSPPADGGKPENALTGTLFSVNAGATTAITVPAADGKMRFWRNTDDRDLRRPAPTATLPDGTLGYEWDEDPDNGFRPAGAVPPVRPPRSPRRPVLARLRLDLRDRRRRRTT